MSQMTDIFKFAIRKMVNNESRNTRHKRACSFFLWLKMAMSAADSGAPWILDLAGKLQNVEVV